MYVIVRPPGPAFRDAISTHPLRTGIEPARAAAQHAAFVAALEAVGLRVILLAAEPAMPDATFVSDTVIALPRPGDPAAPAAALVVARPAAASRRAEVESVAAAARALLPEATPEHRVEAPATLEGGDVVIFGDRIAIGMSARTSEHGARLLGGVAEAAGYRAFLCPVADRLHLATAVTAAGPDLLIGTAAGFASLDAVGAAPPSVGRLLLPDEELAGANVLALAGHAFLAAGNPAASRLLAESGLHVHELDLDEFALADGGPTCLVNLIP